MHEKAISKATLGRLPQYLEYLTGMPDSITAVSATLIANELSLGEVQVRKDLAAISGKGKPRIGYDKEKLIADIERQLGRDELTVAVLVGAGKLGKALLDFDGFYEYGINIIAAFDSNDKPMSFGRSEKQILPFRDLSDFCLKNKVSLGIITTGQGSAQEVLDEMARCGIRAIWNFAQCELRVPEGVTLKQENLALSLAHLKNQIGK